MTFCLSLVFLLFSCTMISQAQKSDRLINLSGLKTEILPEGNRLVLLPVKQNSRLHVQIKFNTPPHLQGRQKGINRAFFMLLSDAVKSELPDSTARKMNFFPEEYSLTISTDSIGYLISALKVWKKHTKSPEFPTKRIEAADKKLIRNNFPPKLPPYEVLKRKNSEHHYGRRHPLGEPYIKEGIKEINSTALNDYYKKTLNASPITVFATVTPRDSILPDTVRKIFTRPEPPSEKKQSYKFYTPPNSVLYFFESPAELISPDTYLSILYAKPSFSLSKKNYALFHLTDYIFSAHENGLLKKALHDTSNTALHVFSEMRVKNQIFEHKVGMILPPENLEKALRYLSLAIEDFRNNELPQAELNRYKNDYLKKFPALSQNSRGIFFLPKEMLRYKLPADYFTNYEKHIQTITPEALKNFARRHFQSRQYTATVFGKRKKMKNQLLFSSSQAKIIETFQDQDSVKIIPYNFSSRDVIQAFLIKTGGIHQSDPHFIRVKSKYLFDGDTVHSQTHIYRKKGKFLQKKYRVQDSIPEKAFDTKLYTGQKAYRAENEQYTELSDADQAKVHELSFEYPEQSYLQNNTEMQLTGIDTIDNRECYAVRIKPEYLPERISYYSPEDSLKLKTEVIEQDSVKRVIKFFNYRTAGDKQTRLIPKRQELYGDNYSVISETDSINFDIKLKNRLFKPE